MSCKGALEQGEGLRTRSFRNEDYSSRRIFLRSYPLQWGPDDDEYEADEDLKQTSDDHIGKKESAKLAEMKTKKKEGEDNKNKKKLVLKKIVISVLEWGEGKVLVYRRIKNKVTFYVISCFPVGLKAPTALISA